MFKVEKSWVRLSFGSWHICPTLLGPTLSAAEYVAELVTHAAADKNKIKAHKSKTKIALLLRVSHCQS